MALSFLLHVSNLIKNQSSVLLEISVWGPLNLNTNKRFLEKVCLYVPMSLATCSVQNTEPYFDRIRTQLLFWVLICAQEMFLKNPFKTTPILAKRPPPNQF